MIASLTSSQVSFMQTKKLTYLSLLTTIALIIFMVEAQIPALVPIPAVKLGLANIVTIFAAFTLTPMQTVMILICRIFLGSLFTGNMFAMMYSMGGGLLCIAVTLIMTKILSLDQLWIASIIGAIFHNIGQLLVAAFVLQTFAVFSYLPVLLISAVITGAFTGFCATALIKRLKKLYRK